MNYEPESVEVFVQIRQGLRSTEVRDVYEDGSTWNELLQSFSRALAGHSYVGVHEALADVGVLS